MAFTGPLQLASQDIYKVSATKLHRLGSQGATRDGRLFRYGLAGAVALSPGKVNQVAAVVPNHQNIAVQTASVVGDTQLLVTLGATATTADQYADGYVIGYDASGVGQTLQIAGNSAAALSTTCTVYLSDPVAIAQTTSGKVNLELNAWAGALVYATGATTEFCNGVTNVSLPIANYGWFQTRGAAAVLTNGTITKGSGVVPGQTTAGSVDIEATGTITQRVGLQVQTGTTTKYSTTFLTID
jgi:hypothetical protein